MTPKHKFSMASINVNPFVQAENCSLGLETEAWVMGLTYGLGFHITSHFNTFPVQSQATVSQATRSLALGPSYSS